MPALVKALRHGRTRHGSRQLLLTYGDHPNVGYPGLGSYGNLSCEWEPIGLSCGKDVQLVMELGKTKLSQFLAVDDNSSLCGTSPTTTYMNRERRACWSNINREIGVMQLSNKSDKS